jgi:hypothetical protein
MAIARGVMAMTIRLYLGIIGENAVFRGVLMHNVSLINRCIEQVSRTSPECPESSASPSTSPFSKCNSLSVTTSSAAFDFAFFFFLLFFFLGAVGMC